MSCLLLLMLSVAATIVTSQDAAMPCKIAQAGTMDPNPKTFDGVMQAGEDQLFVQILGGFYMPIVVTGMEVRVCPASADVIVKYAHIEDSVGMLATRVPGSDSSTPVSFNVKASVRGYSPNMPKSPFGKNGIIPFRPSPSFRSFPKSMYLL